MNTIATRQLRVGFDAHRFNLSGTGTYMRELLAALAPAAASTKIRLVVYAAAQDRATFERLPDIEFRTVTSTKYSPSEQIDLALACARDRLDVLHVPFYYIPVLAPCRIVITIHDLEQIRFAETVASPLARLAIRAMFRFALHRARAVIAVSNHTRNEAIEYLGADPRKLRVIHHAAGEAFEPRPDDRVIWHAEAAALGIRGPYLLAMLGKQVTKKNTRRVIEAYERFRGGGGEANLVFVGDGASCRKQLPEFAEMEASKRFHVVGRVSDPTLRRLYANSTAFLFPSLYEGFGLPILEALRAGAWVITSNTSAMPEVAGEAACLIDPNDVTQIAEAMSEACRVSPAERGRRKSAGQARAHEFSWQKAAVQTLAVYGTAAGVRRQFGVSRVVRATETSDLRKIP